MELNVEKQNRKDMETKIAKRVDDKIYSLRIEVAKEQKQADELLEHQSRDINEQVSGLQNEVDQERKSRYSLHFLLLIANYFYLLVKKAMKDLLKNLVMRY